MLPEFTTMHLRAETIITIAASSPTDLQYGAVHITETQL